MPAVRSAARRMCSMSWRAASGRSVRCSRKCVPPNTTDIWLFASCAMPPASCPTAWSRWVSNSRSWRSLRSVMSRLIEAAPVIVPVASRIGETLSEIQMRCPSLRMRSASENSTTSPRCRRCSRSRSVSCSSGGISRKIDSPTISSAV